MKTLSAILSVFLLGCTANNSAHDHVRTSETGWPNKAQPEEIENYRPWDQAVELLLANADTIEAVSQGHDLGVRIIFRNQRVFGTIEPEIDAIFRVLRECGKRCDHIMWITQ